MIDAKKQFKVLVTGATGNSGGFAVDELLWKGISVRALARSMEERAASLAKRGAEVVVDDFLVFEDMAAALKDIDTAYFCFLL